MAASSSSTGQARRELSGALDPPEARPGAGSRAEGQSPARPLTVLQVVPRLDIGGVERGTLEIVEAIVAAGGRALVATSGGQLCPRVVRAGGRVIQMELASKNPLRIAANVHALARLIASERVDVVHARSRAPAWSALAACRDGRARFVTTYHGAYSEGFPGKRLYNSVMARGRPVIAISDFIRDLVIARHRVPPEQVVTIPRGADVAVFSEDAVSAERARQLAEHWGVLDDTRPIVMLPGRLQRWKGAETVVDAAARLAAARGTAGFLVLMVGEPGDPAFQRELERRIAGHGLEAAVRMVGATGDMPAAYKLASVVLSASIRPEAFGRVIVEAQAMGRPVIATDHGGARETVRDGISGWLVRPGDPDALAAAIERALGLDASARAHMGLAGRAQVHTHYTVARMQQATLAVYEAAAGRSFAAHR